MPPISKTTHPRLLLRYNLSSNNTFIFISFCKAEVVTDLVGSEFLGGRTIIRWSERTDINGRLYLITEDSASAVPSTQILTVGRQANATFFNATSVLVGKSGVGISKRREYATRFFQSTLILFQRAKISRSRFPLLRSQLSFALESARILLFRSIWYPAFWFVLCQRHSKRSKPDLCFRLCRSSVEPDR